MKFRIRDIFLILAVLASGGVLLHVSQKVQIAEAELKTIEEKIAHEEEFIKILRTEWAFLNNPARLENLVQVYLDLEPVASAQLTHTPADYFENPVEEMISEEVADSAPAAAPAIHPASAKPKKDFNALLQQVSAGGPQ